MAQPNAFVVRPSATSAFRRGCSSTVPASAPTPPACSRPLSMSSVACGTETNSLLLASPSMVPVPAPPTIITPRGLPPNNVSNNLRHVAPPSAPSKYVVVALPSAPRPRQPQPPSSPSTSVVRPAFAVTHTSGLPMPESSTRCSPPSARTTLYLPVTYIPTPSGTQARPRLPQTLIASSALVRPTAVASSSSPRVSIAGITSSSFVSSKAPTLATGSVIRLPQGATNVIAPGMNLIPVLSNGNVYFVHPTAQSRPATSSSPSVCVNGFSTTTKSTMVSTSTSTPLPSNPLHKFRFQRPLCHQTSPVSPGKSVQIVRTSPSVEMAAKFATESIESQRRNVSMGLGKGALVDKACQSSLKRRSSKKRAALAAARKRKEHAAQAHRPVVVASPVKAAPAPSAVVSTEKPRPNLIQHPVPRPVVPVAKPTLHLIQQPAPPPVVPVEKPTRPLIQHQMISQFSVTLCSDDDSNAAQKSGMSSTGSSIEVSPVIDDFLVKPGRTIPGVPSPSALFGSSFSITPSSDPRSITVVNNSSSHCAPCYPTPPPSVSSTVDVCRSTPPSPSPLPPSPVRPSVNASPSHCQASSPLHLPSPPRPPKPLPPAPSLQVVKNLSAEFMRPVTSLTPPPPPTSVFTSSPPVPPPPPPPRGKTPEVPKEKPIPSDPASEPVMDAFDALLMSLNTKPTKMGVKLQPTTSAKPGSEKVDATETEVSEMETKEEDREGEIKRKKKKKKKKRVLKKLTPSDLRRLEKRPVKWLNVAPKLPMKMQGMSEECSPAVVERLKDYKLAMRVERRDLFPLGLLPSDGSDEETDSDGELTRQGTWFRPSEFLPLGDESRKKRLGEDTEEEEESPVEKRRKTLRLVKRNLRAQNKQLKESIRVQLMKASAKRWKMAVDVAKAAKKHSVLLGRAYGKTKNASALKALSKRKALVPKKCIHVITDAFDGNGRSCGEASLPLAAYCRQHIVSAPGQHLFRVCEAFGSVTYCDNPAILLKNEAPICEEHMFPRPPPLTATELAAMAAKKAKKRSRNAQFLRKRRRKPGAGKSKCVSPPLKPPSSPPTPPHRRSPPLSPFDFEKNDALEPPFIADPSLVLPEFGDTDNLLDGTDIDALYRMPDDAFSDLFADANGVAHLEPTIEDTKALEEALRAADFDVNSLAEGLIERLTSDLPLSGSPQDLPDSMVCHDVPDVHLEEALCFSSPMVQRTPPSPPPAPPPALAYQNIPFDMDSLPPPPPYSTAIAMASSSAYYVSGSRDMYQFLPDSSLQVTCESSQWQSSFLSEPLPDMDDVNPKEIVLESHVIPSPADFQRQNGSMRPVVSLAPSSGS